MHQAVPLSVMIADKPLATCTNIYRPSVLIVEDDEDVAYGMSLHLGRHYAVSVEDNARDALARYQVEKPEILVLDYQLPDMNGIRLLETVQRNFDPSVTAIMISAYDSLQDAGLRAGFRHCLHKPFSDQELILMVEASLRR